ncbi:MAG: DNA internalization-related competence protein ComEC/Rec2 [Chloroflexi bacterium]|nr:DNA internalization-related competence protein ComEC/Rec2 [Chloroflexota bacterium]
MEWLYGLRQRLSQGLASSLPEPQASLAQAMLLGQRGQLPEDLKDAFARSGTSHLVAISGQNLTILLGLLVAAAVWAWGRHRPHYFVLGLAAIWGYSLLTGLAPPVVRAAIMGSLWLLAGFLGRPGSAGTALALSAAAMAGLSPELLRDVSFQLSFAAMAGLVFLAPLLVGWGRGLLAQWGWEESRSLLWAWDSAAITASATLLTLPIAAVNFHRVSVVGLPATLLGTLSLPGIIVLGGLSALGSALWSPLGQGLAWLAWPCLTWLMGVAQGFAALPLAALKVEGVGPAWAWGYYGLLAGLVAVARPAVRDWLRASATGLLSGASSLGRARLTWILVALLLANSLAWGAFFTLPPASLQVYFLDVGQGDAVLIRTPQNRKILIDGGPSPAVLSAQLGQRLPFWDRTIDLVVLTHPDSDHLSGLVETLRHYQVKAAWEGGRAQDGSPSAVDAKTGPVYREWQTLLTEKGIPHQQAQAGMLLELEPGLRLEVLHPPPGLPAGAFEEEDNYGAVLRLTAGEVSFLFAADLRVEGELYLIGQAQSSLQSTMLKVAHHGSDTSTSPEWLEAVAPQMAVISVAEKNPFDLPSPEVRERLEAKLGADRVLLTSERGTVTATVADGRLAVATEK